MILSPRQIIKNNMKAKNIRQNTTYMHIFQFIKYLFGILWAK